MYRLEIKKIIVLFRISSGVFLRIGSGTYVLGYFPTEVVLTWLNALWSQTLILSGVKQEMDQLGVNVVDAELCLLLWRMSVVDKQTVLPNTPDSQTFV